MGSLGDAPIFRCEECGEEYRPTLRQRLDADKPRYCEWCELAADLTRPAEGGE